MDLFEHSKFPWIRPCPWGGNEDGMHESMNSFSIFPTSISVHMTILFGNKKGRGEGTKEVVGSSFEILSAPSPRKVGRLVKD